MSDSLISVIMPVYNAERYLKKSVDSVLKQTYPEFELILVDDGSTDSSGKLCDEYSSSDKRIKVIHCNNSGVSKARNIGIEASSAKYIVFLDSDDEMEPNLLEDNLMIMDRLDPDVLIFSFQYVFPDRTVDNRFKQDELFFGDNEKFFNEKLEDIVSHELMNAPWNKIIRRDLVKNNKLYFDERYSIFEDAMFSLRVCDKAKTICINDKIYHHYNVWENGSLRTKWSDNRFLAIKELYKLERKYCSRYEDNKHQLHFFKKIFDDYILSYIQLASVNSALSFKKKRDLLREVCNDRKVRQVFLNKKYNKDLDIKKRIIHFLVKMKQVNMIILLHELRQKPKQ